MSKEMTKLFGCIFCLLCLPVCCHAWPRYGRPHPLYRSRQQTNENVLASAVLLGLDFNEVQTLQSADGQGLGLGNLGLPNNGFPMNARERQRARQDVNTLTALGVIDSPEEVGPIGALVDPSVTDPPDNPAANAKPGKKKGAKKQKAKAVSKVPGKGVVKKKPEQPASARILLSDVLPQNNKPSVQTTTQSVMAKKPKTNVGSIKAHKLAKNVKAPSKNAKKEKAVRKKQKPRLQQRIPEGDRAENSPGGGRDKPGKRRNWNRGKHGRQKFAGGGDPGEGRLAEQGGGDLLDRPVKGRGGRVVWRTGGEEGRFGGGEAVDRRMIAGR